MSDSDREDRKGASDSEFLKRVNTDPPTDERSHQGPPHIESVEVDTIDGQWVLPVEVDDNFAEATHIEMEETTGAPVAGTTAEEASRSVGHSEPVEVDTIDGHWVVSAEVDEDSSEGGPVQQQESTGAPSAGKGAAEPGRSDP
jgi:hypothetical protein